MNTSVNATLMPFFLVAQHGDNEICAFSNIQFKGNLSKLRPKLRGYSNRLMNKAIESYNGQVSDGMILLKVGNLKLNNDNN